MALRFHDTFTAGREPHPGDETAWSSLWGVEGGIGWSIDECAACPKEDDDYCIEGTSYGFCGFPECGGACELLGSCACQCHRHHGPS